MALAKAQATQVYAGLGLWPTAVTARLVAAQLVEDGVYPNAAAIFADVSEVASPTLDFDRSQPRDPQGRWTAGRGGVSGLAPPSGTPLGPEQSREPPTRTTPSAAAAEADAPGPYAPDGSPINLASLKSRGPKLAKAIGALLGAARSTLWNYLQYKLERTRLDTIQNNTPLVGARV